VYLPYIIGGTAAMLPTQLTALSEFSSVPIQAIRQAFQPGHSHPQAKPITKLGWFIEASFQVLPM
jgi:hypothetical protein